MQYTASRQHMSNREWFKNAKFGMFIHWGLYSLLGGEWKGQRTPYPGEWLMTYCKIPIREYEKLAQVFNPIYFDVEEWVRLAKEAGMQYVELTAKHQEGFCLFKSEVDSFNVVDATPFKRDVVAEVAEACKKYGLKLGLYYSQELDFREEHGGGISRVDEKFGCDWSNTWDFPDASKKDFLICFEKKIKPQLKELLTKYGDLLLIWFDDPCDITPEQSMELYHLVKEYQQDCLVPSRVGNGIGDIYSYGDNEITDEDCREGLWEAPITMNDTWAYESFDNNWKSADRIMEIKEHLNSRGVNLLLNVGPDHLGRIPALSIDILKEVGRRNK